jgi:hypothetical protein
LANPVLKLFPLRCRILGVVYEILRLLYIAGHMLPFILNSRELVAGVIGPLGRSRDSRFLPLQPVDENCALCAAMVVVCISCRNSRISDSGACNV